MAMRATRLANGRKWCRLGDLMAAVGWNKNELVAKLEEKRKSRAGAWFQKKARRIQKGASRSDEE